MEKTAKILVPILSLMLVLAIGCAKKPPIITSINPNTGPSGGGTQITITGENFKEGANVTIAGIAVKNLTISPDKKQATAVTPGGPPGAQQVIATNLKAKKPSEPSTFTYEALKVTSTVPADGTQVPVYPRLTQASATFSQDLQPGTEAMSIADVTGTSSYDATTKTLTFTASASLKTNSTYTVTVSGAKDMAGNVMPDYTFSFTIEAVEKVAWYTVQEGDTLPIIAAMPEIYEDEEQWGYIFRANQDEFVSDDGKHGNDAITDRYNLKPGMVLYIPH